MNKQLRKLAGIMSLSAAFGFAMSSTGNNGQGRWYSCNIMCSGEECFVRIPGIELGDAMTTGFDRK